ncbi:hypothetical protein GCM10017044_01970 [Kordiimonas sediminis]|uniref:DUF2125 domain-containing protein n=1 Tax=Kordiimonas sediminis TaxID=1735581 RepID=A0A919E438_9PROT|nr:DUF2125 domain-containing protein [Kordiimonas sediminis]GHF11728.1 hypothetical protein GCM10017044_01970 [Kordiimonas sediminis]
MTEQEPTGHNAPTTEQSAQPAKENSLIRNFRNASFVLITAVLVYSGVWYTTAFEAKEEIIKALNAVEAKGHKVKYKDVELEGFPYRIIVTIPQATVISRSGNMKFQTRNVTLISHVWTPTHWMAEASDVQASLFDRSLEFTDDRMRASYRVMSDKSTIIAIDSFGADDFTLTRGFGFRGAYTFKDWQLFFRLPDVEAASPSDASGLYGTRAFDFKAVIDKGLWSSEITGGLIGDMPKDWTENSLANWRDEGGLLMLDSASLTSSGSALKGSASIALDMEMRPLGSANFTVRGADSLTALLAAATSLDAHSLDNGIQKNQEDISLLMQNGTASLNGTPVKRLSPIID